MQYKTIILELLLQQRPEVHEHLRKNRELLTALDFYAQELRTGHEIWRHTLSRTKPDLDPNQIASSALELALRELEVRLRATFPPDEQETLSLDAAVAFLWRPTSSD